MYFVPLQSKIPKDDENETYIFTQSEKKFLFKTNQIEVLGVKIDFNYLLPYVNSQNIFFNYVYFETLADCTSNLKTQQPT